MVRDLSCHVFVNMKIGRCTRMRSWDEFTRWQWVTARPQAHGFPF